MLSTQFGLELSPTLITQLVSHFQTVSGRDIKELLKLVVKWCRHKETKPSLEIFKACAQFRGL